MLSKSRTELKGSEDGNFFLIDQEKSKLDCIGQKCEAVMYSERIFSNKDNGKGHEIKVLEEKAYSFVGWYVVYKDGTCVPNATRDDGCVVKEGQTDQPAVFILGAISGIAIASAAILSSMLF